MLRWTDKFQPRYWAVRGLRSHSLIDIGDGPARQNRGCRAVSVPKAVTICYMQTGRWELSEMSASAVVLGDQGIRKLLAAVAMVVGFRV